MVLKKNPVQEKTPEMAELMKKFALDEFEVEILSMANKGETSEEIAEKLEELLLPTESRMMRSIPVKFEVKTFEEAMQKFKMALLSRYISDEGQFIVENLNKITQSFNLRKIARFLKVGNETVKNYIEQGFLKGNKSERRCGLGYEWIIDPQDFYDFLRNYYYCYYAYDLERGEDEFLRSVMKFTPAGIPICQAVKTLGVSRSTIKRRIAKGDILAYLGPGHRKGSRFRWYIQPDKDRAST